MIIVYNRKFSNKKYPVAIAMKICHQNLYHIYQYNNFSFVRITKGTFTQRNEDNVLMRIDTIPI